MEDICLAAVAEGLGTVIAGFSGEHRSELERLLELPEGYELTAVIKVGVPDEEPSAPQRRPDFSRLHKNRFGQH